MTTKTMATLRTKSKNGVSATNNGSADSKIITGTKIIDNTSDDNAPATLPAIPTMGAVTMTPPTTAPANANNGSNDNDATNNSDNDTTMAALMTNATKRSTNIANNDASTANKKC